MTGYVSVALMMALQASSVPAPAPKSEEKLVCKRFIETGSLVKGHRECKTEREWQRERDNARQRGDGSTGCGSADNRSC